MAQRRKSNTYYTIGGKRCRINNVDTSKVIRYKNPNYKPSVPEKKSKAEQRAEKIKAYSQEHDIKLEYINRCISAYLEKYPDKVTCAGNENGSNRFINECLKEFKGKNLPFSAPPDFTDDLLIFLLLLIWWDEKSRRVTSFSRYYELWRVETLQAILYYLSLYPDKIFSEGCENMSDRFLRACVRHTPNLAQKMRDRGIEI